MLRFGTLCYAIYFVVSFPSCFRVDEQADQPPWSLTRTVIEASFVSITSLLLLDLWARLVGPIV